jgi:hypothetical protein
MKTFACSLFVASTALWTASPAHAAENALLTERSAWGDLARFAEPTQDCPGGSLEKLRQRVGVAGPSSIEELDRQEAEAEVADHKAGPGRSIVWLYPVSDFIRQKLRAPAELYTFEFSTDPSVSPWWGFRGLLVAREDCLIHAEITGFDHG